MVAVEEGLTIKEPVDSQPKVLSTVSELPLRNVEDAKKVLETGQPLDTGFLLQDTDVLIYGERHIDYAIPDYLLQQVPALKNAGVTSFGFEVNPHPSVQEVFDAINKGNFDRAKEIDWSLGYGNPLIRQTKQDLVVQLAKAGITVYPFASWDNQGPITASPYTKESEEQAGTIIANHAVHGKTVVLVGAKHAEYSKGRKRISFPHTADCLKALDLKTRSVIFAGGMANPLGYDRDPEEILRRGVRDIIQAPTYIDTTKVGVKDYYGDGILILPEVPFLAANQPLPPERMPVGEYTPLQNVQPPTEMQDTRATISSTK